MKVKSGLCLLASLPNHVLPCPGQVPEPSNSEAIFINEAFTLLFGGFESLEAFKLNRCMKRVMRLAQVEIMMNQGNLEMILIEPEFGYLQLFGYFGKCKVPSSFER